MALTGAQVRAARGLVRWSQGKLAQEAGVSPETIKRLEGGDGRVPTTTATESSIERALEAAGVIFIAENGEGPGVRLKKQRGEGGGM